MNKIILIGNLTRDPERAESQSGTVYAKFTVATNVTIGDKKKSFFYACTAFNGLAETICKYCHKGDKVSVIGDTIEARGYLDKNGEAQASVECVVREVEFLTKATGATAPPKNEGKAAKLSEPIDESDIPF